MSLQMMWSTGCRKPWPVTTIDVSPPNAWRANRSRAGRAVAKGCLSPPLAVPIGDRIMTRWFPALAFAFLLLSACVTSTPIHQVGLPDPVTDTRFTGDARPVGDPHVSGDLNPVADATGAGAVDEAARESREKAEAGARTGRRVGIVAGTLAAVLGGPHHDSVEGMVGRYVITRDAATVAGAIIGGVKGGKEGAKRG